MKWETVELEYRIWRKYRVYISCFNSKVTNCWSDSCSVGLSSGSITLLHPLLCTLETFSYLRSVSVSQPAIRGIALFLSVFQQWKILKRKGIGDLFCDEFHIVLVIALFVLVNSLEVMDKLWLWQFWMILCWGLLVIYPVSYVNKIKNCHQIYCMTWWLINST